MSGSVCQKPYGEAASAKVQRVTHSYYDGILTAYTPAIDHGQGSGRGGRCGLGMKARVRKVTKETPRRNGTTRGLSRYSITCIVSGPLGRRAVTYCVHHTARVLRDSVAH